ncbi:Signal transduction histidine kinase [Lentzea albidocapillata subsp. violacea]|uniref:histidine kinase n=1 Tax=Lentzea albidocapillata subsp. violacea TaxID=128104 RepID=A0A1G9QGI1_9PSEU|nr:sensor domain-containing protein [Lentzea albidocapillata]SDM10162.1 Signal transduction histidine kinase [Lentzea albidocapillata subsp. violacea]
MKRIWASLLYLATGLLTAMAAWLAIGVLLLSVVVLPLLPITAPLIRRVVDFDRRRLARFTGAEIPSPPPLDGPWLHRAQRVLTDPDSRRDGMWVLLHALFGTLSGSVAIGIAGALVQQPVALFLWWTVPGGMQNSFGLHVDSWAKALLSVPIAVVLALLLTQFPRLANLDATWARKLLAPPKASLEKRLAEVVATRAAALQAHGAELRRIERNLHDGTQNKLVGVVMMLGIAERTLQQNPDNALQALLRAQDAAGDALEELRNVVRSIHPPVLEDLGLDGAIQALAARCPVPCVLTAEHLGRLPAAVEAAAYFAVAEALTNVAKHSGAKRAWVSLDIINDQLTVIVHDDGKGGADEKQGTGLDGIRGRVAALDGNADVSSPEGGPTVLTVVLPAGR